MTDVLDDRAASVTAPVPAWRRWAALLTLPVALTVAWAVMRWSGTSPFGSDNDEYRLVAGELVRSGQPVVAGVEATKYPLGYPIVLALLDVVGLPVTRAALALNLFLVVGLAAVVGQLARSLGQRLAAVPAALYAVGGAGLWGSVFVTMPDLAFVVAFGAVTWWVGRLRSPRDVAVLVALVAVASLLKSVGLLVGLTASVAVLAAPRPLRRLAWAPAVAGLAVTVAMAALNAAHPEHTTGYARTFFLVDPTDATAGEVSLLGLLGRIPGRAHLVLRDVEVALVGPHLARPWAWLLGLVLLATGVWATWGAAPRRVFVVVFLAGWLPAMAVWPYSSVRFQLPLLVIAAAGVGRLAHEAGRRAGAPGVVAVAMVLGLHLWGQGGQIRRDATFEAATLGVLAADTDAAARWGSDNIPQGDVIASFAYREVAYRLDRPVVPLGYTGDMASLLADADVAGARWLVVMPPLYRARGLLEERFVATFADRLRLAHDTPTVDTYELLPAG